jgi:hypothetical protein
MFPKIDRNRQMPRNASRLRVTPFSSLTQKSA